MLSIVIAIEHVILRLLGPPAPAEGAELPSREEDDEEDEQEEEDADEEGLLRVPHPVGVGRE